MSYERTSVTTTRARRMRPMEMRSPLEVKVPRGSDPVILLASITMPEPINTIARHVVCGEGRPVAIPARKAGKPRALGQSRQEQGWGPHSVPNCSRVCRRSARRTAARRRRLMGTSNASARTATAVAPQLRSPIIALKLMNSAQGHRTNSCEAKTFSS